jgi:hypothetical protein
MKRYIYQALLFSTTGSFIYYALISRIFSLEFDTLVFLTILESVITRGAVLIPFADGIGSSICEFTTSINCTTAHPPVSGQQLYTQFPTSYTSGLTLLLIPKLLHWISTLFLPTAVSITYLVNLYALSAAFLVIFSGATLASTASLTINRSILFVLLSLMSIALCVSYGGDIIVGELFASVLIASVGAALLLTWSKKTSTAFYAAATIILGIAIECKISTLPLAMTLLCFIMAKYAASANSLRLPIVLLPLFLLPKIVSFFYIFASLSFDFSSFLGHLSSFQATAASNANAGINWGGQSLTGQFQLLTSSSSIETFFYVTFSTFIIAIITSILNVKSFKSVGIVLFALIISIAAAIYPFVFKFPFPRIWLPFCALMPVTLLSSLTVISHFSRLKLFNNLILLIPSILMSLLLYLDVMPSTKARDNPIAPFNESYPDEIFPKSAVFFSNHFFSFPWDIYLSENLTGHSLFKRHSIYSYASARELSGRDLEIYLLSTCRWGHCQKSPLEKSKFKVSGSHYPEGNRELTCTRIPPATKRGPYFASKCSYAP